MKNSQKGFITPLLLALVAVLIVGGTYVYVHTKKQGNQATTEVGADTKATSTAETADWKTYQNQEFGFSIKYPPQYTVNAVETLADNPAWKSATFLFIFDPKDTSKYEFHVSPVHIVLQRQPIIWQGKVYHTIDDLIKAGVRWPATTEIVFVNGERAAYHQPSRGDAEDAPIEEYVFIKNDIIYEVILNSNDEYHTAIVQSIEFH